MSELYVPTEMSQRKIAMDLMEQGWCCFSRVKEMDPDLSEAMLRGLGCCAAMMAGELARTYRNLDEAYRVEVRRRFGQDGLLDSVSVWVTDVPILFPGVF